MFFVLILLLILIFFGSFWGTPWVPTKKKDFNRIAKLAQLQPGMLFYDLGSGTGELLFYLAKRYNVNCVGIEVSPFFYLYSKIKSFFCGKVKIKYGNFLKYDLSEADIIYIFLLPKTYNNLKDKINNEAKKNSKIIASTWPFRNSKPVEISKKNNEITYYLYNKASLFNGEALGAG